MLRFLQPSLRLLRDSSIRRTLHSASHAQPSTLCRAAAASFRHAPKSQPQYLPCRRHLSTSDPFQSYPSYFTIPPDREPPRGQGPADGPSTDALSSDRGTLHARLTSSPQNGAPVYALSFLGPSPLDCDAERWEQVLLSSPAVMGWVKPEFEDGLSGFVENSSFRKILHQSIRRTLDEGADDIQVNGAIQTGQGWMHIHDDRNPPPLGRIGEPDDIIGTIRVEDGKIIPGTYNDMPSYRLATADGLIKLTDGIQDRLLADLEAVVRHGLKET